MRRRAGGPRQASLLDLIEAAKRTEPPAPARGFAALFAVVPRDREEALLLQIKRDLATIAEGEFGAEPGREFYERRVAACRAELCRRTDDRDEDVRGEGQGDDDAGARGAGSRSTSGSKQR